MQSPHFRIEGQPTLGIGVLGVRYDGRPMPPYMKDVAPPVTPPAASAELLELMLAVQMLQSRQDAFRREVQEAHDEILLLLEEMTWAARWRRFRLWVVAFFKE